MSSYLIKTTFVLTTIFALNNFAIAQTTNWFPLDGNVGIGTTTPLYKLDVSGTLRFGGSAAYQGMLMGAEPTPLSGYNQTNYIIPSTVPGSGQAKTALRFKNLIDYPGQNLLDVIVDGNLGLGITSPTHRLTIDGDVKLHSPGSGYYVNYATLSETKSGLSTLLGNNIKTGDANNTFRRFISPVDLGSFIALNYVYGITFHTGINSSLNTDVPITENESMRITHNGNVGIGTPYPANKLHVAGGITTTELSNINGFTFDLSDPYTRRLQTLGFNLLLSTGAGDGHFRLPYVATDPAHLINMSLVIDKNVGIGTSDTKGYKLAVAGNMIAESVKVKPQTQWPDYVFTKSYPLPTLQETEKHIKEKGHLQGIPSAAEVKANGIDLGEMNAKLLQKIEELTLHLIEQNKMIREQQSKLEIQQKSIEKLNSKLR